MSKNAAWLIEQPHGSILYRHPRFEWLTNTVAWASRLQSTDVPSLRGVPKLVLDDVAWQRLLQTHGGLLDHEGVL